ncbi:MFS transporter [Actinomadura sp. NTSP31]|uniref:MFS transporter n=1 Tax=Actinomadura sp. NTSP31 TaxID=1735447 RepID=UPI0035C1A9BA
MSGGLPRPVRALIGVRVINQLGAYVMAFLAVLAGPDLASAALAVFGVAALASRWLGGVLLDRLAPRTLIALGLAGAGAALLVLAAAHGPPQTLGAVALVGLAFEIYEPATQEALARAAPAGRQSDVYGVLGTSLVAAGAVGGLLAAVLLPLGARWLAVVDAATCLAAAALALAFLPHEPVRRRVRDADSALQGRWQALIAEIAPEAERPRWFAFFGSSWGVAQPAVPGLAALAGGAMPVAAGAFLLVPLLLRRPRHRASDTAASDAAASDAAAARGRAAIRERERSQGELA